MAGEVRDRGRSGVTGLVKHERHVFYASIFSRFARFLICFSRNYGMLLVLKVPMSAIFTVALLQLQGNCCVRQGGRGGGREILKLHVNR